jgi:hypothetical protein
MNHNKFNTHTEEKQPNYTKRRIIAGISAAAIVGTGIGAHEMNSNDNKPQLEPKSSNIEDYVSPHDLIHEPVTINDGENIVVVSVKEASELRNLPENEVQQPVTARILEEQAAETIPRITHAGDKVTVRYNPIDDAYDVDVTVHNTEE